MRPALGIALALSILVSAPPAGLRALPVSGSGPEEVRIGVSFGGISFMGFLMEYRWGSRSVEMNIGTWSFRDLSVSVLGKQYFGPGDFRPFAGFGLWTVIAPPREPEDQTAVALMLRAPVGVEWNVDADHHLGGHISLNRALMIRRRDPRDDFPASDRLIPLPGFYYVWKR
jgi:hypothetical protein